MPRAVTKFSVVYLALSPNATATALGIRSDQVFAAIEQGALPVFQLGTKRRILVSDIEAWVRSWKTVTRKRKVPKNG